MRLRIRARFFAWTLTLVLVQPILLRAFSRSVVLPTHIPDFVTECPLIWEPSGFFAEILVPALPHEEPLRLLWSDRIVSRLVEAESKESNAWFRDDYRVARVTVGFARRGSPIPLIEASYAVFGAHPDQIWPRIVARREALLARDYEKVFGDMRSPRKPVGSVALAELKSSGKTNGAKPDKQRAA